MVPPFLGDSEHKVKISRETMACRKLPSGAGVEAQSPQAQPLSQWLLGCEEQLTREQDDGGALMKPQMKLYIGLAQKSIYGFFP